MEPDGPRWLWFAYAVVFVPFVGQAAVVIVSSVSTTGGAVGAPGGVSAQCPRVARGRTARRVDGPRPATRARIFVWRALIDRQQLSFDAYAKFIEDTFLSSQRLDPGTEGRSDARPDVREAMPTAGDLRLDFDEPGVSAEDNPSYGYLTWGSVEIHLSGFDALDPKTTTSVCYLFVDDADALYAAWSDAGIAGRFRPPMDTLYGKREFGYVDPDGNLLRVGSQLRL